MAVEIALALADSPRFAPLALGDVWSDRLRLKIVRGRRPDILRKALSDDSVAGGEGSLAGHLLRLAAGDRSFVALPVFVQRAFVARYLYTRADAPRPLQPGAGRVRIGVYSRVATGTVWLRHFLGWRGVESDRTEWVDGPVDPDADPPSPDLTGRLLAGEIDLMFSAETPLAVTSGSGAITRCFADPRAIDRAYFSATGIFPPQHVLILRRSLLERVPWIAGEIESQFNAAEQLFLDNQAHNPFGSPWEALERDAVAALMGAGYFRHGLGANRPVLQAFIDTAQTVGLVGRAIAVDELFGLPALAT